MSMLFKRIKDWATSITAFRTGDVIPVDGPSGTAKMSKDDLLKVTAENALSSIHSLSDTATEADLKIGNYLVLDGTEGTKRLPAEVVAKARDVSRLDEYSYDPTYSKKASSVSYDSAYGYMNAVAGQPISFGSQTYWIHASFSVSEGENYYIEYGNMNNYSTTRNTIVGVDSNDIVVEIFAKQAPGEIRVSTRKFINIPSGVSKIYVLHSVPSGFPLLINSVEVEKIQENVERLKEGVADFEQYKKAPTYDNVGGNLSLVSAIGNISGNVGETLNIDTRAYMVNSHIDVTPGEYYIVKTKTNANNINVGSVFAVDDDLKIIAILANGEKSDDYSILQESYVKIPEGATKLYVKTLCILVEVQYYCFINRVEKVSLKTELAELISRTEEYEITPTYVDYNESVIYESAVGFISGNVGETLNIGTQAYWVNSHIDVVAGESYRIRTKCGVNAKNQGYIYAVDDNLKIIAILAITPDIPDYSILQEKNVAIPEGATKLYVMTLTGLPGIKSLCFINTGNKVKIRDKFDSIVTALPGYYYPYIENKIKEINARQKTIKKGVSFAFVTDSHWPTNALQSGNICKEIVENTTVPFVIHGGDFASAYGDAERLENTRLETIKFINTIGKGKVFISRGNHDFTIRESSGSANGTTLPAEYTYDAITRPMENFISNIENGKFYFYIDVPSQKTRIFILCSCDTQKPSETAPWGVQYNVREEQVAWLKQNTKNVEGWNFVFISHITANPNLDSYDSAMAPIQTIASTINNKSGEYVGTTNKVACCIAGHSHKDQSGVLDGVLHIMTTSDAAYNDGGWTRTMGTTTEQAIDVFHIDVESGKIYSTRVGAGENREWNI